MLHRESIDGSRLCAPYPPPPPPATPYSWFWTHPWAGFTKPCAVLKLDFLPGASNKCIALVRKCSFSKAQGLRETGPRTTVLRGACTPLTVDATRPSITHSAPEARTASPDAHYRHYPPRRARHAFKTTPPQLHKCRGDSCCSADDTGIRMNPIWCIWRTTISTLDASPHLLGERVRLDGERSFATTGPGGSGWLFKDASSRRAFGVEVCRFPVRDLCDWSHGGERSRLGAASCRGGGATLSRVTRAVTSSLRDVRARWRRGPVTSDHITSQSGDSIADTTTLSQLFDAFIFDILGTDTWGQYSILVCCKPILSRLVV